MNPVIPEVTEAENEISFSTEKIRLVFTKDPIGFDLYDQDGSLLYSELHGSPCTLDSNHRVNHYSCMD